MHLFSSTSLHVLLLLSASTKKIADRHGESVGQKITNSQDEDDADLEIRAEDAGDDGEGGYSTIGRTVHKVPEITVARSALEPGRDRLCSVLAEELRFARFLVFFPHCTVKIARSQNVAS